ncbi:7728_t:CDS:1, partial [Gigaspora rosea]
QALIDFVWAHLFIHYLLIYEVTETFSIKNTNHNYAMHDRIDFDKIVEINSGGLGVIYKSECKYCKITTALKRLKDDTQDQNFNRE